MLQALLHRFQVGEIAWGNLVFPLNLRIQFVQILDQILFLRVLAKHGRHLLFQPGNYVSVDLEIKMVTRSEDNILVHFFNLQRGASDTRAHLTLLKDFQGYSRQAGEPENAPYQPLSPFN